MNILTDFRKYALSQGVHASALDQMFHDTENTSNIYPGIIEERAASMRAVEMNVFSRLMYDRIIYFSGEVTSDSSDIIIAQLLYLESTGDKRDINMYINSPGGDVVAGLGIIDTMDFISSNVNTTCIGMCASMGAVLLSNGQKGKRSILKHGRVMIHSVSSAFKGHTADVRIEMEQSERCQKDLYEILAKNTEKTYEEINALCDRDNWFIGQEAVELGIVDKVLEK
jgi:ATP-dependent Clp protease protease subunit